MTGTFLESFEITKILRLQSPYLINLPFFMHVWSVVKGSYYTCTTTKQCQFEKAKRESTKTYSMNLSQHFERYISRMIFKDTVPIDSLKHSVDVMCREILTAGELSSKQPDPVP